MKDRITSHMLQIRIDAINEVLNRPANNPKTHQPHYNNETRSFEFTEDGKSSVHLDRHAPGGNPYQYKLKELRLNRLHNPRPDERPNDYHEHDWTNYRMTVKEFYAYLNGILDYIDEANGARG